MPCPLETLPNFILTKDLEIYFRGSFYNCVQSLNLEIVDIVNWRLLIITIELKIWNDTIGGSV